MPTRNVKVPEAPTSLNKLAARGRIYREDILGARDISAEDADPEDVETLTKLIQNAETQMETKESSDIFCLSLEMSEQEVAKRVEVLKNLRRDCAIKLSTDKLKHTLMSKGRNQRLEFKTPPPGGQVSPALSMGSRSKSSTPKPSPPPFEEIEPPLVAAVAQESSYKDKQKDLIKIACCKDSYYKYERVKQNPHHLSGVTKGYDTPRE